MGQDIKAEEKTLENVFSNDYSFQIPYYQRPYAWTEEQTGELLDDLCKAAESNPESPYFLGSIVLNKVEEEGRSHFDVIDGQQRLTTLTILFCVLRELAKDEIDKTELDGYIRARGGRFANREEHFRLQVRNLDKEFFERRIQGNASIEEFIGIQNTETEDFNDSRRRMHENAKYLWNELKVKEQSERDFLASFMVRYCYLVIVSASSRRSAHRIFSVLNARGLDLLPTDILKADIIGEMPANEREPYTKKWDDIEDELGRDDFNDLFTHIRMIHMKKKAQGSLEEEFRENVTGKTNPRDFIDDTLEPMTDAYRIVSKANYQSPTQPDKINAYLKHLDRIDNKNWIPPAICFFDKYKDNQDILLKFICDLERLAYALFILRKNVNERIARYARIIQAIHDEENLYREDLGEEKLTLQLSEKEKTEMKEKLGEDIYKVKPVCKPLLLRLDSLLADEGAEYTNPIVSVEHVLPQNPKDNPEWFSWFPNEQERQEWIHKLANLVLLSKKKNSKASNYDFKKKKEKYFKEGGVVTFALTNGIILKNEWTPDVLRERQKELIDLLCKEWRL